MTSILRPGHNVWRIEPAARAAVLIDAANFFQAVREAFLKARRSIYVVGWDIDSRTRLVGPSNAADDGFPVLLSEFLNELVQCRPELRIHLLLWDFSLLYANEREMSPRLSLQWSTSDRVSLCLDNTGPFGCSQHQKIIVVDDALAFSGGLDLTIRRWDTPEHSPNNEDRVDPAGKPYRPFHDVQMMVDGAAAQALAALVRSRWCRAMGEESNPIIPEGDPWPDSVAPDFHNIDVGIARTVPLCDGQDEVREVETLFADTIATAERTLYIENQFATAPHIAEQLASQAKLKRDLEMLIVAPRSHDSWVESQTMRNGRIRFWKTLRRASGPRARLMYPAVEDGKNKTDTMIHSKVMIIDDRILRIGSANLNNRSMGADTECDLVVEGRTAEHRRAIMGIRNKLLGEHCGVSAGAVEQAWGQVGSMLAVAETLSADGHRLKPIEDGEPDDGVLTPILEDVADPKRPLQMRRLWGKFAKRVGFKASGAVATMGIAAVIVVALSLAWYLTPLSEVADPEWIRGILAEAVDKPWAIAFVLAVFVIGGLVAFPVTVLIIATAAVFGPWLGLLYATAGALGSALVTYLIGARFGQETMRRVLGARARRIRDELESRGVLAIAAIRVVPVAPFTVVNLAAGASAIRLTDFMIGTAIGMAPGLVVLSALGHSIARIMDAPTAYEVALLMLAASGWIALSLAAQALVSWRWSRSW